MSFIYGAGLWQPASAAEHASDILGQINAVLQANSVKDSGGNVIQFAASLGNVVWILCLALGNIRADDDLLLLQAAQQFSIAQESDAQLLATLPMTGTTLIPGAYSLVTLNVTADASGATVPAGTKAALGTICNFLVLSTTTIGSGSTAAILCQSDTLGPIQVAPGQLTSFATTVPHVTTVTNPAGAVVGRNIETTQQLRQRLLGGNIINTNVNGTIRAIQGIQGITQAVMFLNQSPTTNLALQGGTQVPALNAYIVVAGTDITGLAIASAYADRMLAPTFSLGSPYLAASGFVAPITLTGSAVTFLSADNSINYGGSSFVAAGFLPNQWISILGTGSNNFTFKIGSVTASKIVVTSASGIIGTESPAGNVTITAKNVQVYTTAAGQLFPIQFDYATNQPIYMRVYYELGTAIASGFDLLIQQTIAAISWTIGQPVTAAAGLQALTGYQYARITGAQVSKDGVNWYNEVYPNGNSLPYITVANVTVIGA